MLDLSEYAKWSFYRARNGAMIVIGTIANPCLYSPDGEVFYEMNRRGWGGGGFTIEHPSLGEFRPNFSEDDLVLNEKEFLKAEPKPIPAEKVKTLPVIRVPEYTFVTKVAPLQFIYLSRERYPKGRPYEDYRMYVGPKDGLLPVEISLFQRMGASNAKVVTPGGTLRIKMHQPSTWDGDELASLNIEQVVIIETAEKVTLHF